VIRKIRGRPGEQIDHFDKQYPGLCLRVSQNRKSWAYVYRLNGKQRRVTFDTFPAMSVAKAHDAWRKARDEVLAGVAPKGRTAAAEEAASDPLSFKAVFNDWMARDQADNKSARAVRQMIEKEVLPKWKDKPITSITKRDVLDAIDTIADRGHIAFARRLHARLHRLFRWAERRDIIPKGTNPAANVDKPGAEVERDRVLSDAELVKVWRAADKVRGYGAAVKMLILTGARREEIGRLRWDEIDGDQIELKGARTKNGEPHIIPLSAPARALLETLDRKGDYVFTIKGAGPLAAWSQAKDELDGISGVRGWRVHDLRRTFATNMQKLGVALQVTETCLGHTAGSRGGIVGVYQRHNYLDERRAALEAWGRYISALIDAPRWKLIKAELAAGDKDAQDKARRSFIAAITGGFATWEAYLAGLTGDEPRKVVAIGGR
jgi:integrase